MKPHASPSDTDGLIDRFCDTWWGYGSPSASGWIVGMEEGGGTSWPDICRHLAGWEASGSRPFVDLRPDPVPADHPAFGERPRLVRHWARSARIALGAAGQPITDQTIRQYQRQELAAPNGDTCLVELLPLPSPTTNHWLYGDHSDLPWLADRSRYAERMLPRRTRTLAQQVGRHRPDWLVFLGASYRHHWDAVMGQRLPRWPDRPTVIDGTVVVVIDHPAAHGTTNDLFDAAGTAIHKALGSNT